jgi:hypothetical protein
MSTQVWRPRPSTLLECAVAVRARAGESECGDRHVIRSFRDGVLVAVVDGLGHGRHAAAAARTAAALLEEHAGDPLPALVERCHAELAGSRGVVMSLASVDGTSTLSWLGIGNVEATVVRPRTGDGRLAERQLLLRAGIVGSQLPALRPARLRLARGDMLGMATDGIRSGFGRSLALATAPQRLADAILAEYGRADDDALVVVARFKGVER